MIFEESAKTMVSLYDNHALWPSIAWPMAIPLTLAMQPLINKYVMSLWVPKDHSQVVASGLHSPFVTLHVLMALIKLFLLLMNMTYQFSWLWFNHIVWMSVFIADPDFFIWHITHTNSTFYLHNLLNKLFPPCINSVSQEQLPISILVLVPNNWSHRVNSLWFKGFTPYTLKCKPWSNSHPRLSCLTFFSHSKCMARPTLETN